MSATEHKELALFDALTTLGIIVRNEEKIQCEYGIDTFEYGIDTFEYGIDTFEYPSGLPITIEFISSNEEQAKLDYIEYIKHKYHFIVKLAKFIVNGTITNVACKKYVLNYEQAGCTFGYYIDPSNFWQVYDTIYDVIVELERVKSL